MLTSYLVIPFVFAFLIGISFFLKNPIYIRRLAKVFFVIHFIYSNLIFFCVNESEFAFLNLNFILDNNSQFLLILASLIFFLYSIFSKMFILKLHKVFYAISFLLLGLVNFLILSDNIFISYFSLFCIILVNYFLFVAFSKKQEEKTLKYQLVIDMMCYFVSFSLILLEFARFFVINDIGFAFSNLNSNLYKIEDFSITCAFFGLLIIISRLFNFLPFNGKNLFLSNKINPFVYSLCFVSFLILGCSLFLKTYINFDYLFYQFQDEIGIFLLLNFAFFVVMSLRQKNLFKFLTNVFSAVVVVVFFSIFSFESECNNAFLYSIFALCLSYCLSAFVFMILIDKFKTDELDEFKKIQDKTRISQFFITISLLNMASIPLLSFFGFELICFMIIFSTEYKGIILNIVPYCLALGVFLISLSSFGVLYKILIEPVQKVNIKFAFCNHQIIVCAILVFALIILGIYPEYIFKQMSLPVEIGQF